MYIIIAKTQKTPSRGQKSSGQKSSGVNVRESPVTMYVECDL